MNLKHFCLVSLLILGLYFNVDAKISLIDVKGNLRCSTVTSGLTYTSSNVGNDLDMNCNPKSNTYSRLNFNVEIGSKHNDRLSKSFYFTSLPGFGSNQATMTADGCLGTAFSNSIYKRECVKLGLPLRTLSGSGNSIFPNTNSNQLKKVLNISSDDINHIIEGYEINLSFGWTRWTYDLSNSVQHLFPYEYDFKINNTQIAYQETIDNIENQPITEPIAFTKCYPNIVNASGRLNGVLNSCVRTPCNCSGNAGKDPSVPDYYTYEVNYIAPMGQVRKVLNNGRGRLTVDVMVTLNAVVFLKGEIIYKKQIMQKLIYDMTSNNLESSSLGSVGSSSGVDNQHLRLYSNKNNIQFGSAELGIDQYLFPAVTGSSTLFKLKASLIDSYIENNNRTSNKNTYLGSSIKYNGKIAAPNLDGGYIVDFLTDQEMVTSPYRTNANSPYNIEGIPSVQCAPPDSYFYVSNAMVRKGVYFANNLRESCGKIGTSSAAMLLDISNLNNYCCNNTLITGSCLPGLMDGNFPSPKQVLTNCTLFNTLFSPPGWRNYNYYMIGRNSLNLQMPNYQTSGMNPLIYGAPSAVFDLTIEISDILITPLVGNNAFNVNIPPLSLSVSNDPLLRAFNEQPFGCIFDSSAGGKGIFYVQKICNVGTNGGLANVSIGFEGCQHMKYFNLKNLVNMSLPIISIPLNNRQCTQEVITIPITVNLKYANNATCDNVYFSSTYGSTKEINIPQVQCYDFVGFFTNRTYSDNYTIPAFDCTKCDSWSLNCLNYCSNVGNSLPFWIIAIFPITIIVLGGSIGLGIILMQNCHENQKKQFKENNKKKEE